MEISLMKRLKKKSDNDPQNKLEGARIQESGVRSQKKTLALLILISILLAFARMPRL